MLFMGRVVVSDNSQMDAGPSHLKWSSALTAVWPIFSAGDQIVYVHTVDSAQCSLTSLSQNTQIRRSVAHTGLFLITMKPLERRH